jgi:serine/threonine protein kinase
VERPATSDRTDIALGGEVLPPGAEPLQAGDPPAIGGNRLTGRLASGGTSVVYLARDPDGELVAVKTTRARKTDLDQARRWLRTEAASSRRVPPFCTARLLVDGSHHTPPYLVSEYVDGPSLGQYVEFLGPLDADQLRALASALARAIAAVHGAGLIHCDLKPGNVLLAADGPRVIDFSIAQEAPVPGRPADTDTVPYGPGWVAPERLNGRPADPATDVFGWGCLVGFAATGHSPFDGDLSGTGWSVARPADLAAIDEPLRALVEAALAVDPADRPSIGEITQRLGRRGEARATSEPLPPRREPEALAAPAESPSGSKVAPAWDIEAAAAIEPYAPPEDMSPARSAVDEPTAPLARIAPEPAYDPAPEPAWDPVRETDGERAYEPSPETPYDAPSASPFEGPSRSPYEGPAASPYDAPPKPPYEGPAEPARDAHRPPAPLPVPASRPPAPAPQPPAPAPVPGPAGELSPRRDDRAAYDAGYDRAAYVPGLGHDTAAGHLVDPAPDAFDPREERRPRRPRRLRAVAMVTAPAALVAVLATAIAMAGTGSGGPSPSTGGGMPTMGRQDPGQAPPADSPSAVRPHRRSFGPRPASASSARDGSTPSSPANGGVGGQPGPGSPTHSHRPGSPPPSHHPSPTPTHSPTPSPTPTPPPGGSGGGGGTTSTG